MLLCASALWFVGHVDAFVVVVNVIPCLIGVAVEPTSSPPPICLPSLCLLLCPSWSRQGTFVANVRPRSRFFHQLLYK